MLGADQKGRRPEDIELISSTVGKLIGYVNDYISGTKAGDELEFLEKQLFFCISVLRTYDELKTNVNESKMEESLRRLESKTDGLALQLDMISKNLENLQASNESRVTRRSPKRSARKKRSG